MKIGVVMNDETAMKNTIKNIINDAWPHKLEIGVTVSYTDGRMVKIKDGYYLDPIYGRLSNFWTWNEVFDNGLLGPDECGYGWM